MENDDSPPIAALFSVVFDQKVGYSIAWKRSLPDIALDGVEFKSLPSGLHSVQSDLVYFVHGTCAGVSAFVQAEADEQHRNANFVAIGALVPLRYGRLGKSWLHANDLRQLASEAVKADTSGLEPFWKKHKLEAAATNGVDDGYMPSPSVVRRTSLPSALMHKRKRTRSEVSTTDTSFSSDHPAQSMPELLDTFGPLIFPLYRAALLRKRILLLGAPPVHQSCNFVYTLSILSSIPQSLIEMIQPDTESLHRIQALFSVGIYDIPFLTDQKRKARWLACTTDDVLGEKPDLYDVLIKLPSKEQKSLRGARQWPQIRATEGKGVKEIKATQRDLRRYRLLRSELERTASVKQQYRDDPDHEDDEIAPLMRASTTTLLDEVKRAEEGESEVVEPVSWTAMAYNGFLWWASAGEMQAWEAEEARADRELFDEVPDPSDLMRHLGDEGEGMTMQRRIAAEATVVTAYFHHLTSAILTPMADIVEDADDETEEGFANAAIPVSSDDIRNMGLDPWSVADKEFVQEAMGLYFGREATVEENGTRICGVRIC